VIGDVAMRLLRARYSRAGRLDWRRQLSTLGLMLGSLFIRSYGRAERVYSAMACRGYDGRSRTLKQPRWRPADAFFGIAAAAVVLSASLLGQL